MDYFTGFIDFITDSTTKITHKAVTIIFIVIMLILADNIFGLSFYNNLDKKLEVINNINSALKDTTLTISEKNQLKELRFKTIKKSSLKDKLFNFFTEFSLTDPKQKTKQETIYAGNDIVQFVSSSWFILVPAQ